MTLNPNRTKLGRRQKKILDTMIRYGDGYWQAHWHTSASQLEVLKSLEYRGLVKPISLTTSEGPKQVYRVVMTGAQ